MKIEKEHKFVLQKEAWEKLRVKDYGQILVDQNRTVHCYLHLNGDQSVQVIEDGGKTYIALKKEEREYRYPIPMEEAEKILSNFTMNFHDATKVATFADDDTQEICLMTLTRGYEHTFLTLKKDTEQKDQRLEFDYLIHKTSSISHKGL